MKILFLIWLKKCWLLNVDDCVLQNVKISIYSIEGIVDVSMFIVKINIYILFFFLENNVILIGISVIFDLFVEDFIFFNKVDKLEIFVI